MSSILLLGFLIGVQHALEADHVAAVATLAAQSPSALRTLGLGAAWGLGHSLPLFILGAVVLLLDLALPASLGRWLDVGVGAMLAALGADLLARVARGRIHVHRAEPAEPAERLREAQTQPSREAQTTQPRCADSMDPHPHGDGTSHTHAHSHAGAAAHDSPQHGLQHGRALTIKALLVGIIHGLAGSGALILLTLETLHSIAWGLVYIACFAVGVLVGMALLTGVISLPLRYAARRLTLVHAGLRGGIGLVTVIMGGYLMLSSGWP